MQVEHKETRSATRRDGVVITEGQPVTCDIHADCAGCVFQVQQITPYGYCESGYMVLVKFEHEQQGKHLNGRTGLGLDANWFKPHATPATSTESAAGPGQDSAAGAPAPVDAGRAEPIEDSPPPVLRDGKRRGGRKLGGGKDKQLGLEL